MYVRFSVTRIKICVETNKTSNFFSYLETWKLCNFLNYLEGLGPIWAQGIDEKVRELLRRWSAFRQLSTKHKYNLLAIRPFKAPHNLNFLCCLMCPQKDEKVRELLRRWSAFCQLSTKHKSHKCNLQAIGRFTVPHNLNFLWCEMCPQML